MITLNNMWKYFKFKDNFVFNDLWHLCFLFWRKDDIKSIMSDDLCRWDWVKTTYKIDLFTWDINEVFATFESTYIKNIEVKRRVWGVGLLHEIDEKEAFEILTKNQLSVSYLLKKKSWQ